jgi:hypothetical protein
MRYKDKQKKYKPKILRLLKNRHHGMIATDIKEELNHDISRNTIQSYLDQLAEEGKVHSIKVGRYELWFLKKHKKTGIESPCHPICSFLLVFLNELQKNPGSEEIDWKKFGLTLGKSFGFEAYFPNLKNYVVDDLAQAYSLCQEIYPSILKQILAFFGDENIEIDPPIIQEELYNIIFRIRGSKYSDNEIFFQVLCGIEEAEIGKMIPNPITVDVLQQVPEKDIIDINVRLTPSAIQSN